MQERCNSSAYYVFLALTQRYGISNLELSINILDLTNDELIILYIDGLVQERCNSIADALELCFFLH